MVNADDNTFAPSFLKLGESGLPGGEIQSSSANTPRNGDALPGPAREEREGAVSPGNVEMNNDNALFVADEGASSSNERQEPMDENNHKYVGLVNQAMTCYLNSLIQSLYMTPEFRNALYEWEYKVSAQSKGQKRGESSIPCQLQKLFLLLQTTDQDALETRDLTASFGWTASEAYDQHDVQELCRLMFDALEHKWKGSRHEKLIQNLYRGTMQDFVKCLKCGKENVRVDYFLDLPLAVKPFGAFTAYRSIEEALSSFVAPELLEGSNQYFCENCNSKQDAHKGFRVTQFPYLLTIQLKRFDFDYTTMHRIKLNDRMSFPDILNLNPFVYYADEGEGGGKGDDRPSENKDKKTPAQKIAPDTEESMEIGSAPDEMITKLNPYIVSEMGEVSIGNKIDHAAVDELLEQGEYVYELFSVMVHSGSAAGGHYYAFIKNLEQDRWYIFNDQRVDYVTRLEVEKSFGGPCGGWNSSNTNAYMLMYRKVDRARNSKFLHTNELPPHICGLQNKWREQAQDAERQREHQRSLLSVHVSFNYAWESQVKRPDGNIFEFQPNQQQILMDFKPYVTEIVRTQLVSTVFQQALDFFGERARPYGINLSRNQCRLLLTTVHNVIRQEFKSKADFDKKTLKSILWEKEDPPSLHVVKFILDVRLGSYAFPFVPYGFSVFVQRIDVGTRTLLPSIIIQMPYDIKVVQARKMISAVFKDDIPAMFAARIVLESAMQRGSYLVFDETHNGQLMRQIIENNCGQLTPMFYYDGGLTSINSPASKEFTEEDRKLEFRYSRMFEIIDRKSFSMEVQLRFPSPDQLTRAESARDAYQGPRWSDTMHAIPEGAETGGTFDSSSASVMTKEDRTLVELEDSSMCSGRASVASNRSMSMEEIDTGDLGVSGSFCNNTPQMSPSVSEGGEFDSDSSPQQLREQMNADHTLRFMSEQHYVVPEDYQTQNYAPIVHKSIVKTVTDENMSESAASSGHSTVIPSSSSTVVNAPSITSSNSETLGGKVFVTAVNENYRKLDVDSRLSVGELKKWISSQMSIDSSQFVIYKHSTDDGSDPGFEATAKDDEPITKILTQNILSVKLRPPLKPDEKLINILQFDINDNNRENWRTLFECAASPSTRIGDVLLQCLRMYKDIYGEQLEPHQVRLRDLPNPATSAGRCVLSPNDTMSQRTVQWSSNIYLQILDESAWDKKGYPILVRRFRPDTVEVSNIHEVNVDPAAEDQLKSFVEGISAISQIPIERVGITKITTMWERWPFMKNRLEMLDGKIEFYTNAWEHNEMEKTFIEKVGSRVIYYKDVGVEPKQLSEEERKQITIKENGQTGQTNRRKERPLRIQMSSVCEP